MTNEMMNAKIREMEDIQAQIAELKAQAEGIKDELKAELDSRKEDKIFTGIHNIFYKPVSKMQLKTKEVKAYLTKLGVLESMQEEKVSLTFTITTPAQ